MTLDKDQEYRGALSEVREARARKHNRVGSLSPHSANAFANTIGERMAARRMELNLTQARVAEQVFCQHKTGRRRGAERPLSRAAYAMFEIDQTEPDLKKIEAIAKALGVTPGWLAFGGETPLVADGPAIIDGDDSDVEVTRWVLPKAVGARETDMVANDARSITITIRR